MPLTSLLESAAPPLAASGGVADALADLFIVLLFAKLGDEVFKRIHQPAMLGEILAGILIGPSVLALVSETPELELFAELGVVFLLFWVGLETRLEDVRAVGMIALAVGLLGAVLPFGAGVGLGFGIGEDGPASLFLGAALVATSIGITSSVLIEMGMLDRRPSRVILGAGVVDDVVAMILLAVAVGASAEGGADVLGIVVVALFAVTFVAFFALGGTRLMRSRPQILEAPRFSESPLLPAVILCLGLAALAAEIGLAAIIGAFLAGMMVAETREQHSIEREIEPLYAFFPPFFFAFIGIQVDLAEFAEPGTLALVAGVTTLAVATKYVGARIGSRGLGPAESRFVSAGMVPRGEVGIIVAGIGAAEGVIGDQLFAVVVGMSILTTLVTPPLLKRLSRAMGD